MKTNENLMSAFAGESQANRKYLAFSEKAMEENNPGLAKLFRVAAEGETVHALSHLRTAGEVSSSEENLKKAIAGETYEFSKMYPEFIETATEEDNKAAILSFTRAQEIEKIHEKLFTEALEAGLNVAEKEYFICSVCGYPQAESAPDKCPICGAPKEKFRRVE